jgi:hypothetical protein
MEIMSSKEFFEKRNCQITRIGWTGMTTIDLQEFALMHVNAALEAASKEVRADKRKKVLESYTIKDIK